MRGKKLQKKMKSLRNALKKTKRASAFILAAALALPLAAGGTFFYLKKRTDRPHPPTLPAHLQAAQGSSATDSRPLPARKTEKKTETPLAPIPRLPTLRVSTGKGATAAPPSPPPARGQSPEELEKTHMAALANAAPPAALSGIRRYGDCATKAGSSAIPQQARCLHWAAEMAEANPRLKDEFKRIESKASPKVLSAYRELFPKKPPLKPGATPVRLPPVPTPSPLPAKARK